MIPYFLTSLLPMKSLPPLPYLQSRFAYDTETGLFSRVGPGKSKVGTVDAKGYIQIQVDGTRYLAHRLAWLFSIGEDPFPLMVDHKNRIRTDNRIVNLRLADRCLQNFNQKLDSRNRSGVAGVHFDEPAQKWRARAVFQKKHYHLGYYASVEEAAQAKHAFDDEHRAGWKS